MGFIYKIINSVNEKIYIGQTKKSIQKRWVAHKHAINSGKGCPLLARAVNAHGEDKFSIELVEECDDDQLNQKEKEYIEQFKCLAPNGYNADAGGKPGGTFKGHKHTLETIARWKETMKDTLESKEYRENISRGLKAYYANPENRVKHSVRMKEVATVTNRSKFADRFISEETKQKIRDSVNKYYENRCENPDYMWSENNKQKHSEIMTKVNGRRVGKFTQDGTIDEEYGSIKEASEKNNVSQNAIWRYLKKKTRSKSGYTWKYMDENSEIAERTQNRNVDKVKHKELMTKINGRKVNQYSKEGKIIASFNSIKEASEKTDVTISNISYIVRGKGKTAGGYIWKYTDTESKEAAQE